MPARRFGIRTSVVIIAGVVALYGCVAHEASPVEQKNSFTVHAEAPVMPPSATGTFCLLSTDRRCSTLFPAPAKACLLGAERCPRDGKIEPVEDADGLRVVR